MERRTGVGSERRRGGVGEGQREDGLSVVDWRWTREEGEEGREGDSEEVRDVSVVGLRRRKKKEGR